MNIQIKAYEIAKTQIGVKEVAGDGNNAQIIEYHQSCSLKATEDSIPWCSSFVNWCFKKAGAKGTSSAMARSWLLWGNKVDQPVVGDIVVFSRGNNGVSGHVGFVAEEIKPWHLNIYVLGGNQSNSVSIAKYSRSRVLGYRRI